MDRKKLVLLLVALIIAVGTAMVARSMFAGASAPQAQAAPVVPTGPKVLVAQRALPAGTIITAESIGFQSWPAEMVADAYFLEGESDLAKLLGTVVRHPIKHPAVRRLEPGVVLEEVGVSEDVRHDELLLHHGVRADEVCVGRVVVDDELIDLREPPLPALLHAFELHPEAPGGVAHGEAPVGRQRVHLRGLDHLEDDVKEVEAR